PVPDQDRGAQPRHEIRVAGDGGRDRGYVRVQGGAHGCGDDEIGQVCDLGESVEHLGRQRSRGRRCVLPGGSHVDASYAIGYASSMFTESSPGVVYCWIAWFGCPEMSCTMPSGVTRPMPARTPPVVVR